MSIEQAVIGHYASSDIAQRVIDAAGGAQGLTREKLAPFDEMHVGRHPATLHLIQALNLAPGMRVLDAGCGLGGAARAVADITGADVTGIDLTPDYVLAATLLSELVGLGDAVSFETANATATKFGDDTFDAAYTIHVAMNIPQKAAFYGEIFRILRPGAVFGIYDVMAEPGGGALIFPLPWATTAETSFLATPGEVADLLAQAGFTVGHMESRREFGLAGLRKMMERPPETLSPLASDNFAQRAANLLANIETHKCAPYQMVARKPAA